MDSVFSRSTQPDRPTWLALAERCEKATGPDRMIDAEIHDAVYGGSEAWEAVRRWGGGVQWIKHRTASVDAITTLIERKLPGCSYRSGRGEAGTYWAAIGADFLMSAASEPLARCAVFCQAMAEKASA